MLKTLAKLGSEKDTRFPLQIGDYTFHVSLFCALKVGDTENMKFRLECDQNPDHGGEFDDFEGLKNHLTKFLQEELFDYMIMTL